MTDYDKLLLRCPFCGGKARLGWEEYYEGCYSKQPKYRYGVGCDTDWCYCQYDETGFWLHTKEEAIKQWNTRTEETADGL